GRRGSLAERALRSFAISLPQHRETEQLQRRMVCSLKAEQPALCEHTLQNVNRREAKAAQAKWQSLPESNKAACYSLIKTEEAMPRHIASKNHASASRRATASRS